MQRVKCPQCGKETEYTGNEFRPFCSERCRLLDLGAWADEEYNIAASTEGLTEQDVERIERAREENEK